MDDVSSDYSRWRVEHARDTESNTTPRTAAADCAGATVYHRALGRRAVATLRQSDDVACFTIESDDMLEEVGRRVSAHVDPGDVPSRLEIQRELYENEDIGEDELVADQIETRRTELLLAQVSEGKLAGIVASVVGRESE